MVLFTAKKLDSGVKLDWQTSWESNNQGFDIERRLDGGTWERIGFMDGHGSIKENSTYSFLDGNPLPGVNYYRLRQLDFDGKFEFSRMVGVRMDGGKTIKIYPDPTTMNHPLQPSPESILPMGTNLRETPVNKLP